MPSCARRYRGSAARLKFHKRHPCERAGRTESSPPAFYAMIEGIAQTTGLSTMAVPTLGTLKVQLFTDGADKAQILEMAKQPWIAGFTTNPSLLKKAGVKDYAEYGRDLVRAVPDRHISFEVFSDDVPEMIAQGRLIATWGKNVHVKLPVTNTRGEPLYDAVRAMSRDGIKINMTAIFAPEQVAKAVEALAGGAP